MKPGLIKRVLAIGLCLAILAGDRMTTVVSAEQITSVSGGDAAAFADVESENSVNTEESAASDTIPDNAAALDGSVSDGNQASMEGTVSDGDAAITEGTVSDGDAQNVVELQTEVSGVLITLSAPAEYIPEGAELWAEEIKQSTQIDVIDEALAAKAEEEQFAVQKYKAFDIKILVNGEEVQPGGEVTVKFEGDVLLPKAEENLNVYHVTEDAVASDMPVTVTEDNTLEMETNHFSMYVIVLSEGLAGECNVGIHHFLQVEAGKEADFYNKYVDAEGNPRYEMRELDAKLYYEAYLSEEETINALQELIVSVQKNSDYTLVQVVVKDEEGNVISSTRDVADSKETVKVTIEENAEVELYYEPTKNNNVRDDVTYFDYSMIGAYTVHRLLDEATLERAWEIRFSTEENGVSQNYKYIGNCVFQNKATGETYTVKKGDTLYAFWAETFNINTAINVQVLETGSTGIKIWGEDKSRLGVRNTGINSPRYAYDENGVFHGDTYLAMGTYGDEHYQDYYVPVMKEIEGKSIELNLNTNNSYRWASDTYPFVDPNTGVTYPYSVLRGSDAIIPGIVQGLSGEKYETVVMGRGIFDPGYFTSEELVNEVNGETFYDKKVYADEFQLRFERDGYTYQLASSVDTRTGKETKAGLSREAEGNFFPLNGVEYKDTAKRVGEIQGNTWDERYKALTESGANSAGNNCYFGMRYDFHFSIGDYVGPLEYTFTGDDDLWVFVDGHLVLDLGGVHSAYPQVYEREGYDNAVVINHGTEDNTVDLWNATYVNAAGETVPVIDPADKDARHQVTVLFMERGGYDSTCFMEFVLPNVTPVQSVITNRPTADVTFTKTDDAGNVLPGATFELRNTSNVLEGVATSDKDGRVTFPNLPAGTYILKETAAPEGYELNSTTYTIWVKESADGKSVWVESNIPENRIVNRKLTEITVIKEWLKADGSKMAEAGADSITVQLYRNEEALPDGTVVLNKDNNWTFTYKDLYAYDSEGRPYTYEVKETVVPKGYEVSYEKDTEKGILYIRNMQVTGSLTITKKVDEINLAYGAPVFTFKIKGPDGLVLYRTITFENAAELEKTITVTGLPAGAYTVEELPNLRYDRVAPATWETKSVTKNSTPSFVFENHLTSDKYYSHSDVIINSFRMDEEGNVTIEKTREVTEEVEVPAFAG